MISVLFSQLSDVGQLTSTGGGDTTMPRVSCSDGQCSATKSLYYANLCYCEHNVFLKNVTEHFSQILTTFDTIMIYENMLLFNLFSRMHASRARQHNFSTWRIDP